MFRATFGYVSVLLLVVLVFCNHASLPAEDVCKRTTVYLAKDTVFETTGTLIDSGKSGPKVLVIAGFEGDDYSAIRAAHQLSTWSISCGKVVVFPRFNKLGIIKNKLTVPAKEPYHPDEVFPLKKGDFPEEELPRSLWKYLKKFKPDYVVELRESKKYYSAEKGKAQYWGNTVRIVDESPMEQFAQERATQTTGLYSKKPKHEYQVLKDVSPGSLTYATQKFLGVDSMVFCTMQEEYYSWRSFLHRTCVRELLVKLQMQPSAINTFFSEPNDDEHLRVAIYNSSGVGNSGSRAIEMCLGGVKNRTVYMLTAQEIREDSLKQFDLIAFPGGVAKGTSKSLGEEGRKKVIEFVKNGGGYLGICAGAYLATSKRGYSLDIINALVKDGEHWARGSGDVKVEVTEEGQAIMGVKEEDKHCKIRYCQGPLLMPANRTDIPPYTVLAWFRSEVAKNGAPKGVMVNTPAIICAPYHKGRVVVVSPHPEAWISKRHMIKGSILWAARSGKFEQPEDTPQE